MASSATPRRWFRFRLRSLLLSVTAIAILLGWIARERRISDQELQRAQSFLDRGVLGVTVGGPYDSFELRKQDQPQGWLRDTARVVLGERILGLQHPPHKSKEFCDLTKFAGLSHLRCLSLGTQVRDLGPVADFSSLERFSLRDSEVSDLTPLARLKGLTNLTLDRGKFDDLTPLAGLTKLKWLSLIGSKVDDLTPLGTLENLEALAIANTPVSDIRPLARLKKLKTVNLGNTKISDITPLAGLPNLAIVTLTRTQLTTEQVDALQKALPNCKIWR